MTGKNVATLINHSSWNLAFFHSIFQVIRDFSVTKFDGHFWVLFFVTSATYYHLTDQWLLKEALKESRTLNFLAYGLLGNPQLQAVQWED